VRTPRQGLEAYTVSFLELESAGCITTRNRSRRTWAPPLMRVAALRFGVLGQPFVVADIAAAAEHSGAFQGCAAGSNFREAVRARSYRARLWTQHAVPFSFADRGPPLAQNDIGERPACT
jgi:hypothetical protein